MIFKRLSDTNDIKSYLIQKNTENVEVTKFTSETAVNLRILLGSCFSNVSRSLMLYGAAVVKQCEEKLPGK